MKRFIKVLAVLSVVMVLSFVQQKTARVFAGEAVTKIKTSIKSGLSSLALTEEGSSFLSEYDRAEGNIVDPDGDFEAILDGTSYKDNGFTKKDLKYMSSIIYCETGSMSFAAKVAVANVVLNRMRNCNANEWGHVNTVYDVIYDRRWGVQFSPAAGNPSSMDKALALYSGMDEGDFKDWQISDMTECIRAAKAALAGYKTIPDEFMYFNGYIERSRNKCLANGWEFSIMEKHIYFRDR